MTMLTGQKLHPPALSLSISRVTIVAGVERHFYLEKSECSKNCIEGTSFIWIFGVHCSSGTFKVRVVVLYRPPYSPAQPVTTSTFSTDFADYLETLILSSEPLVITRDFNVHVHDSNDPEATIL